MRNVTIFFVASLFLAVVQLFVCCAEKKTVREILLDQYYRNVSSNTVFYFVINEKGRHSVMTEVGEFCVWSASVDRLILNTEYKTESLALIKCEGDSVFFETTDSLKRSLILVKSNAKEFFNGVTKSRRDSLIREMSIK